LPNDYFEPVRVNIPTVVVSTEADPSGFSWSKEVASLMRNAVQVFVPGVGHTSDNDCLRSIRHALFRSGTTKNLDTSCIAKLEHPQFRLPSG